MYTCQCLPHCDADTLQPDTEVLRNTCYVITRDHFIINVIIIIRPTIIELMYDV